MGVRQWAISTARGDLPANWHGPCHWDSLCTVHAGLTCRAEGGTEGGQLGSSAAGPRGSSGQVAASEAVLGRRRAAWAPCLPGSWAGHHRLWRPRPRVDARDPPQGLPACCRGARGQGGRAAAALPLLGAPGSGAHCPPHQGRRLAPAAAALHPLPGWCLGPGPPKTWGKGEPGLGGSVGGGPPAGP